MPEPPENQDLNTSENSSDSNPKGKNLTDSNQDDLAYSSKLREAYFNNPELRHQAAKRRKRNELLYKISLGVVSLIVCGIVFFLYKLSHDLPSLEQLENPKPQLATEIYSADGVLLTKFFNENRTIVPLDSISKNMIHALIATEDVGFYHHWGFDSRRFISAISDNISGILRGKRARGASTITQQLAKNLYVGNERSLIRKIKEIMTAIQVERTYTKNEILGLYLNTVYFGEGAYGVEAASWTYFAKPAAQLSIGESAILVSMLKNPTKYNPTSNAKEAISRRNLVIDLMAREGFVTSVQATKEKALPLKLNFTPVTDVGYAPYFTEYIRQQLKKESTKYKFDILRDGLIVYTTLDTRMQAYAEAAMAKHLPEIQKAFNESWNWNSRYGDSLRTVYLKETERYDSLREKGVSEKDAIKKLRADKEFTDSVLKPKMVVQASFVAIDPVTGHIKAWIGGNNLYPYEHQFDHVWQAKRQPGSTFKPFTYLVAIDKGIPPNYQLLNQPIAIKTNSEKIGIWMPENSDRQSGGLTSLREALRNSMNQVTIRLITSQVFPTEIVRYAKRMGIDTPLDTNASLGLGSSVVTLLELTSAYGTYANGGIHTEPIAILGIQDKFGSTIATYKTSRTQSISPETNYIMVTLLRDVILRGTGMATWSKYGFKEEACGKTGTTQNNADGWFMGFTPQLVAGVWTGFDDQRLHYTSMEYGQGSRSALPIWSYFMKSCYADSSLGLGGRTFSQPAKVFGKLVSNKTKRLAASGESDAYIEYFTEKSLMWYNGNMGRRGADTSNVIQSPTNKKRGEGGF